jgi:hypothetical protein
LGRTKISAKNGRSPVASKAQQLARKIRKRIQEDRLPDGTLFMTEVETAADAPDQLKGERGMPAMKSVIRAGLWVLTAAFVGWLGLGARCASALRAAEPVTRKSVVNPGPNRADEALAETVSLASAHRFLDAAALSWQKERKCFSCHTDYAYLYARPVLAGLDSSPAASPQQTVRDSAEQLVLERWPSRGPRWDAEVVAIAAALAFQDARTTGRLHPATPSQWSPPGKWVRAAQIQPFLEIDHE